MKTKKRIISLILVLALTLGAIPAYAAEPETQGFSDVETIDLSAGSETITKNDWFVGSETVTKKDLPVTMDYNDFLDAERLEPAAASNSIRAANDVQTISTTSSLEPDETNKMYSLNVPAGAMIQAEVQVPHKLSADFDVVLFWCDMEEDVAYAVAQSAYVTNEYFTEETVSVINASGVDSPFIINIIDSGTHTAEDYFTLTVSIGGERTAEEPNDNALTPLRLPEFTEHDEFMFTTTINTPIDHDWYVINVDDASEYYGTQITLADGGANYIVVDSYTFDKTTFSLKKTGSTRDKSILPLTEGDNYFHIYYDRSKSYQPYKYTVTFSSRLIPAYARVVLATNGYCSRPSTQFADGQTRYMLVETEPVQIRVFYYAADGTPVKVNDTISVEIHNPSWDADSMRYARGSDFFEGKSSHTVTLERPGYVRGFEVRYNMVGVTVTSARLGTIMSHASYALIDRYNDDYLSKPCIHNGTCGFR